MIQRNFPAPAWPDLKTFAPQPVRELAELEAQLKDMAGFVGFIGGAGTVSDNSES